MGSPRSRVRPDVPRRVGAVGAARPARSAAGPGAAQRRRLIKYGSIRQRASRSSSTLQRLAGGLRVRVEDHVSVVDADVGAAAVEGVGYADGAGFGHGGDGLSPGEPGNAVGLV